MLFCKNNFINHLGLQTELKSDLFGQNLAINYISSAFRSHYKNIENSPKALAITLHGTTGTGKNYATDIIIRNIFKYGEKSKYIKKYLGRLSFPSDNKVNEYRVCAVNSFNLIVYRK